MKKPLSEGLQTEMNIMRETAIKLRAEMSSQTLRETLDLALRDLDEIPRLFTGEEYMRQAMMMPTWRIRFVLQAKEKYGPDAVVMPGDFEVRP